MENTKVLCVYQIQEVTSQRPCLLEVLLTGILGCGVKKAVWKRNHSVQRSIAYFSPCHYILHIPYIHQQVYK